MKIAILVLSLVTSPVFAAGGSACSDEEIGKVQEILDASDKLRRSTMLVQKTFEITGDSNSDHSAFFGYDFYVRDLKAAATKCEIILPRSSSEDLEKRRRLRWGVSESCLDQLGDVVSNCLRIIDLNKKLPLSDSN